MSVVLIPEFGGGTKQAIIDDSGSIVLDFCLRTPTPCWVRTVAGDFGFQSPWHIYLASHFIDPHAQTEVLRAQTIEEAEATVRKYKHLMREDFSEIKDKILAWTIKIHLNARFKELLPLFNLCRRAEGVYYLSDNKRFGCKADPLTHKYVGTNFYGRSIKKLISAFCSDPTKFLHVPPPDVEDFTLLGSQVRTYTRTAFYPDAQHRPGRATIFGSRPQHKSEKFLES